MSGPPRESPAPETARGLPGKSLAARFGGGRRLEAEAGRRSGSGLRAKLEDDEEKGKPLPEVEGEKKPGEGCGEEGDCQGSYVGVPGGKGDAGRTDRKPWSSDVEVRNRRGKKDLGRRAKTRPKRMRKRDWRRPGGAGVEPSALTFGLEPEESRRRR